MDRDQLTAEFASLFAGRDDAYGSTGGGCIKLPVSLGTYEMHLWTPNAIGIYPVVESPTVAASWADQGMDVGKFFVKWGCSDIDDGTDKGLPLAVNLSRALTVMGIPSWVERTKSKGYHVWVFAEEWVPALVMRRALLVAHQVAGAAPTEVNPKQTDLNSKTYGNYVNLPYPHGWQETNRRVILSPAPNIYPMTLGVFVESATERRVSFDALYEAAKLYKEPPKPVVVVDSQRVTSAQLERYLAKLPGLAYTIWKQGPLAGRDRSGTLQRLAHLCAEAELNAAETLAVVTDADERWGKFSVRPDGEQHLQRMIEVAYG